MKKILISTIILFISLIYSFSQDIIYDKSYGNHSFWFRVKINDSIISTFYENSGIAYRSKVLMAAGFLDGLKDTINYDNYYFNSDTLIYEFKSDTILNLIVYKYYYNDSVFKNYIGLRKSPLGSSILEGKYLIINPFINFNLSVYNGIGSNKRLFYEFNPNQINDTIYKDYSLSNEVSLKIIGIRGLRAVKSMNILESTINNNNKNYNILIWPNPVLQLLNISSPNNEKEIRIRIFDELARLKFDKIFHNDFISIDMMKNKPGVYIIILSDANENIIYQTKLLKISNVN